MGDRWGEASPTRTPLLHGLGLAEGETLVHSNGTQ